MKTKLFPIFIIGTLLFMYSCKKDLTDPASPSPTNTVSVHPPATLDQSAPTIVGKWYLTKVHVQQTSGSTITSDTSYTLPTDTLNLGHIYNNIVFTSDGEATKQTTAARTRAPLVVSSIPAILEDFYTYKVNGSTLTLFEQAPAPMDNIMVITDSITTLSATSLVLHRDQQNATGDTITDTYYSR